MRELGYVFIFLTLMVSCGDSEDTVDEGCVPFIISADQSAATAHVEEAELVGDCLMLKVGVGGCDDDHMIDLLSNGAIGESLPVQMTFRLRDNDPQLCNAYFMIDRAYDLSDIRDLTEEDRVLINFEGSDITILYEL